jgi:hypothetical protein
MQGHSSSMVSTGCWLFCIIQPGLRTNFSRESLQPSHWGRRWVVQHPQLTLWDRVRGTQHSLKAGSHLGEGPRGQGVRWNVPTSIPGPTLRWSPRECPLPIPTNPLPPPVRLPSPPQTHKWSMRFPKSRPVSCFVASCQKPEDVSSQASPLSKSRCIRSASTSTPSLVICVRA